MGERFSIIVPTCGRRSLARTLESIRRQPPEPGDEVLVIADGPEPVAEELFDRSGLPGRYVETAATRDWGGTQRNRGMDLATGDYLLFMDDDDVFAAGALATVRAALAAAPGLPHLFRMRYPDGGVLWTDRVLRLGNVSTQMLAWPNRPDLARWDQLHGHDYRFLVNNLGLWPPGSLVWREEVVALIRPHEAPAGEGPDAALLGPPAVDECPFREAAGEGPARCRLLGRLGGTHDPSWWQIERRACEACCAGAAPSAVSPGPVLASLLYSLADSVVDHGGVAGCPVEKAILLRDWAESQLGVELRVLPRE